MFWISLLGEFVYDNQISSTFVVGHIVDKSKKY